MVRLRQKNRRGKKAAEGGWQLDEKGEKVRDIGSDTTAFRIEIMDADGANRRRLKLAGARFVFIGSLGDW